MAGTAWRSVSAATCSIPSLAVEEWIGVDQERVGPQFGQGRERGVNVIFSLGLDHLDAPPVRTCGC
jgi:hypothetical protein